MSQKHEGNTGVYLAVDVGGTKTLMAIFDETGMPKNQLRFPTPDSYDVFLHDFKSHLPLLGTYSFDAAGIAIPGNIDRVNGVGTSFGNLSWKNVSVKADLEAMLGCSVYIENDAKVGGLSEAMLINDDFKHVLYVTIGTGIGIALINDGVIDTEYGDRGGKGIMIQHNGEEVTWEETVSGSAILRRFGMKASDITDDQTWKTIAHDLALGLAKVVAEKSPEAIVIGGGAGKNFDRYGEPLKQALAKLISTPLPSILPAKHPEEAVIYGCIDLIKQQNG